MGSKVEGPGRRPSRPVRVFPPRRKLRKSPGPRDAAVVVCQGVPRTAISPGHAPYRGEKPNLRSCSPFGRPVVIPLLSVSTRREVACHDHHHGREALGLHRAPQRDTPAPGRGHDYPRHRTRVGSERGRCPQGVGAATRDTRWSRPSSSCLKATGDAPGCGCAATLSARATLALLLRVPFGGQRFFGWCVPRSPAPLALRGRASSSVGRAGLEPATSQIMSLEL